MHSPMLMPRATIQRLTCGAMGAPCRPLTAPGFTVSKRRSPVSGSVAPRPQPRNSSAAAPESSGWAWTPAASACHASRVPVPRAELGERHVVGGHGAAPSISAKTAFASLMAWFARGTPA